MQQERRASSTRQLLSLAYFWSIFRAPETFILVLILLAAVLSLALIIPQQPSELTNASGDEIESEWIVTLPPFYQRTAPILTALGFFRLFETAWFWLPLAFLVLVSLVVLADYAPLIWHRLHQGGGQRPEPQPHPFNWSLSDIIQVPAPSEANKSAASGSPLTYLQGQLEQKGYRIQVTHDEQQLVVTRFSYRWGAPILVMAGILLILIGLVIQALWGSRQVLDLSITDQNIGLLDDQRIRVQTFRPTLDPFQHLVGGEVTLLINGEESLTWQLYHPYRFEDWWIIPGGIQPGAQIDLSQNRGPIETIRPVFPNEIQPAYFIYREQNLRFALHYRATLDGPDYLLTLPRQPNGPEINQSGRTFTVPALNLVGRASIKETLRLRAYHLPGLGPILGGIIMATLGLVLLSLSSPSVMWLTLVTKGRGSRIDVVAETLRTMPPQEDDPTQPLDFPLDFPTREEGHD